ncbi:hypothetical protein ACVIW2_005926 [Bradyrhizobium huanghuaihaiense]
MIRIFPRKDAKKFPTGDHWKIGRSVDDFAYFVEQAKENGGPFTIADLCTYLDGSKFDRCRDLRRTSEAGQRQGRYRRLSPPNGSLPHGREGDFRLPNHSFWIFLLRGAFR